MKTLFLRWEEKTKEYNTSKQFLDMMVIVEKVKRALKDGKI
jgi:hypothetical protein